MSWPLPQEFNEAVQTPRLAFADPDLKAGEATVGPLGLPLPRSGNFADVYQIRGATGRDWAVKCFTRPVPGLDVRYRKVGEALARAALPFTVGFTFLGEGVRVRDRWLPALKMEWVEGFLLNQFVRENAANPAVLAALLRGWVKLCHRLRSSGIAHCDLQHGNVLLVPGSKPGAVTIKLIDYDGMYVPALANTPSGEVGHANYQHPQRAATNAYSPDLDRFPHLVIATALKAVAALGPRLWEKYDTGDNLLFTEPDFKNPAGSALMRELWAAGNPALAALVGHLALACGKPIPQTPWLDQIAPDGEPIPPRVPKPAAAAEPPPEPPPAPPRTAYRRPRQSSGSRTAVMVGGGFLLLAGVVAGVLMATGKKPPAETAQGDAAKPPADEPRETRPALPPPPPKTKTPAVTAAPTEEPPDADVQVAPAPRRVVSPPAVAKVPAGPEVAPPPRAVAAAPPPPAPGDAVVRLPVPDAAALERAEAKYQEVFADKLVKKTAADRRALALELIGLAEKTPDDPAARYVMLREARDLAAEAQDATLAARAADGLGKWYAVDTAGLKLAALEKVHQLNAKDAVQRAVAEAAAAGADAAEEADDYDGAVRLAALAAAAVRKGNLGRIALEDADFRLATLKKTRDAFLAVKPAFDTLRANPDDPAANATAGRFRCFVQGRWEEGAKLLAKGDHPALKAAGLLEAAAAEGPPDAKVAEAWWEYAAAAPDGEKKAAEGRARHWYHAVRDALTGFARAEAEKRLGFTAGPVEYRPGLLAEFSSNRAATVPREKKARIDPGIDFSGSEFPDGGRADLNGKWTGVVVAPRPGRYKFVFDTRDPVRVRLAGATVPQIDTVKDRTGRKDVAILLTDKPTAVVVEVFGRNDGGHGLKLTWVPPGKAEPEPIPPEYLYHDRKAEAALGK